MATIVVLALFTFTSIGAYFTGIHTLHLSADHLRTAVRRLLEAVGLTVIFLGLNLAAGIVAILSTRALSGEFVSVYLVNDVTIGILSLLQGLTFHWWRAAATIPKAR